MTRVSKTSISIKKIQRYKELKAQQQEIEQELEQLKQYFENRLSALNTNKAEVDCYSIQSISYVVDNIKLKQFKEEQAELFNQYKYSNNIKRLVVK